VRQKNCLIVTTHYRPLIGGALTVYDALASNGAGSISVLTASEDYTTGAEVVGWQAFDAGSSYKITRVTEMRPRILPVGTGFLGKLLAHLKARFLQRKVLSKTLKLIEADQIDIVCIGAQDALGWMVAPLQKYSAAKVIIYVHGEEVSQSAYSEKAEDARRAALNSADGLVAVSRFTATLLHEKYGVPAGRITLQNNGVDLGKYSGKSPAADRKKIGLPEGCFVFACGRLVERKGFDRLVEAWPTVVKGRSEAMLVIGGGGPLETSLKSKIEALNIRDSVCMPGWMSEDQLIAAYGLADVFTMPNRTMPDGDTEGFGLVFLEAAAMGTPSVGGRAGGAVDAVIEGETGLLVDGNSSEEIAEALLRLLGDDDLRCKMAKRAQEHAQTQGWKTKTGEFLRYLQSL